MSSLHRSAAAEEIAAHNAGVLVGAGAVLRVLGEVAPPGWARYISENLMLDLPDGTRMRLVELVPAVGSEAADAAAGPEQEKSNAGGEEVRR